MPETAVHALERTLARLRETEPYIHAYAHVDAPGARAAAEAADSTPGRAVVEPLHGVPFAVKEVIAAAGMPVACGSRALADVEADRDAEAVGRLRRAGAVLVGTHVSHELTCGLDEPPTRNPWALDRYPGGSSAGGGASVAVGSAQFALGTDAAGSVRIPAAMTGVVGLKPAAGRVSMDGVAAHATAPSLDHLGIMARRVADVEDVLRVVAAIGDAPPSPADPALPLAGARLAYLGESTRAALHERASTSPDVDAALAEALRQLRSLGAEPVAIDVPSLPRAGEAAFTIFPAELGAANRDLLATRSQDLHGGVRELLERGLATPASRLAAAARVREALERELSAAFARERVDALVTPTTPRTAMSLEELDPAVDLGPLTTFTCPFNLTGHPAVSLPCGFTREGLPIGLQLVGRPFADTALLRIAAAYEQATTWHTAAPAIPTVTDDATPRSAAHA